MPFCFEAPRKVNSCFSQEIHNRDQPWHRTSLGTSLRDQSTNMARREQEITEPNRMQLEILCEEAACGVVLRGAAESHRQSCGQRVRETPLGQNVLGCVTSVYWMVIT